MGRGDGEVKTCLRLFLLRTILGCQTPGWVYATMRTFDYVIANRDRNRANILVDPNWEIVLVDHTCAFVDPESPRELPDRFDRQLVEKLRGLSRPALRPV